MYPGGYSRKRARVLEQKRMELEQLRREYLRGGLSREDLHDDPIEQFQHWLKQALDAGLDDPTAMTVATVASDGQPSQRIVLLKHVDTDGFVFYTNFGSRKARDLEHNQRISCLLYTSPSPRDKRQSRMPSSA